MEKRYYNAETLRDELDRFEERFGISSEVFYETRAKDEGSLHIPPFDMAVWAATYREWQRFRSRFPS